MENRYFIKSFPLEADQQWAFVFYEHDIAICPDAEEVGTLAFAEAFNQARLCHREYFDDSLDDSERSGDAIRWREMNPRYESKLVMGLRDVKGELLDTDWAYRTLYIYDCPWIREHPEEKPIVEHYMPVSWHKKEINTLKAQMGSAVSEKELEVISRLANTAADSRLSDVEDIIKKHIRSNVRKHIEDAVSLGLKEAVTETAETINQRKHLRPTPIEDRAGWVYVLKQIGGENYKIGHTKNLDDRMYLFRVKLPFKVEFEITIQTADRRKLETELHNHFKDKRVDGEWFTLSNEDLDYIRREYAI